MESQQKALPRLATAAEQAESGEREKHRGAGLGTGLEVEVVDVDLVAGRRTIVISKSGGRVSPDRLEGRGVHVKSGIHAGRERSTESGEAAIGKNGIEADVPGDGPANSGKGLQAKLHQAGSNGSAGRTGDPHIGSEDEFRQIGGRKRSGEGDAISGEPESSGSSGSVEAQPCSGAGVAEGRIRPGEEPDVVEDEVPGWERITAGEVREGGVGVPIFGGDGCGCLAR